MFFAFLVSYDCIPGHDIFVFKISIRPYPMPALSQTHRPSAVFLGKVIIRSSVAISILHVWDKWKTL